MLTGRQFCTLCIVLLGIILIVQICVLVSLVGRLVEIRRAAAVGQDGLAKEPLASESRLEPTAFSLPSEPTAAPRTQHQGLAIGVAFSSSGDGILLFLVSLLKVSTCHVVLLMEDPLSPEKLQEAGVDASRVSFERVVFPLPSPWSSLPPKEVQFWLFHDYLSKHPEVGPWVQLSDVDDVAFQADPFKWAQDQPNGLHLFGDEAGRMVAQDTPIMNVLRSCFDREAAQVVGETPSLPEGYLIGTLAEVKTYVQRVVDLIESHQTCLAPQVSQAMQTYVARKANQGLSIQEHRNRLGPVWTGAHVRPGFVLTDSQQQVIQEDGFPYAVLHQYPEHKDVSDHLLLAVLNRTPPPHQEEDVECKAFDVQTGDIWGMDLDHRAAELERDCCAACSKEINCGGFVYSPGRQHCWMKQRGASRSESRPGDDVVCGILRPMGILV